MHGIKEAKRIVCQPTLGAVVVQRLDQWPVKYILIHNTMPSILGLQDVVTLRANKSLKQLWHRSSDKIFGLVYQYLTAVSRQALLKRRTLLNLIIDYCCTCECHVDNVRTTLAVFNVFLFSLLFSLHKRSSNSRIFINTCLSHCKALLFFISFV